MSYVYSEVQQFGTSLSLLAKHYERCITIVPTFFVRHDQHTRSPTKLLLLVIISSCTGYLSHLDITPSHVYTNSTAIQFKAFQAKQAGKLEKLRASSQLANSGVHEVRTYQIQFDLATLSFT